MSIAVKFYAPDLARDWLEILEKSRNGIFLFDRTFIEYHGNRFKDVSVVAYLDGDPVALLPASIDEASSHVTSHAGLTFGGIVLKREVRGDVAINLIHAMLDFLKSVGAKTLTLKLLPPVFATYPSSEIEYVLWRRGFSLMRRDLSSLLPLHNSLPFNKSKSQAVKKARKSGLIMGNTSCASFHSLLEMVLGTQHGVKPVHSLNEIEFLTERFPEQIFVRTATYRKTLLAGALIFNYGHIWHTQYLASSEDGRMLGALDFVISSVIDEAREKNVAYLSFGASTENSGITLNNGLLWQKESYGARSITHDFVSGIL